MVPSSPFWIADNKFRIRIHGDVLEVVTALAGLASGVVPREDLKYKKGSAWLQDSTRVSASTRSLRLLNDGSHPCTPAEDRSPGG
jgi:hypothetical protein